MALDREARHRDRDRQHPEVADRDRPAQQQQQEQREHGEVRVPRVAELVGTHRVGHQRERDEHGDHHRQAAAPERHPPDQPDRHPVHEQRGDVHRDRLGAEQLVRDARARRTAAGRDGSSRSASTARRRRRGRRRRGPAARRSPSPCSGSSRRRRRTRGRRPRRRAGSRGARPFPRSTTGPVASASAGPSSSVCKRSNPSDRPCRADGRVESASVDFERAGRHDLHVPPDPVGFGHRRARAPGCPTGRSCDHPRRRGSPPPARAHRLRRRPCGPRRSRGPTTSGSSSRTAVRFVAASVTSMPRNRSRGGPADQSDAPGLVIIPLTEVIRPSALGRRPAAPARAGPWPAAPRC